MRRPLKAGIVAVIRAYQRYVSPFIPANCRYIPTCSEYMLSAIQQHGTRRGLWLGIKRIGRCHPFGGHGYDPVPGISDQKTTDSRQSQSSENPASEAGRLASKQNSSLTGRKSNNG